MEGQSFLVDLPERVAAVSRGLYLDVDGEGDDVCLVTAEDTYFLRRADRVYINALEPGL